MEFVQSDAERRQEPKKLNTTAYHCSVPALLLRD